MFSTCGTIALIQALRDWEAKGARLPEAVRVEVEYLEGELAEFERDMGDPFETKHNRSLCAHGHPRRECEACEYSRDAENGLAPRW